TNLRQLPETWLKMEGFQHVTGAQLDGLSVSWFSHFLRWLQSGSPTRRPSQPASFLSESLQRLRALPPGTATIILPDGPEQDELLFHLAAQPGQRRLTLVLTPGVGRIMSMMHHWRELVPSAPLSCVWVTSGREIDKNENMLPGEMDFPRILDVGGIRHFFTNRDGNPRILWATYAAIPLIQQAQLGLPPIELTLLPDSHVLSQQSRLLESLLESGLPASRLRLHVTSMPQQTHPLKKNRQEQPAIVYTMDDTSRFGHPIRLSTLSQTRNRHLGRDWKLLLVPVEEAVWLQPETRLVDTLSACLKKYPTIRHCHVAWESSLSDPVAIPDHGEFPVVTLENASDALAWLHMLRNFSRMERGLLAYKTLPSHIRHHATCDLTVLPSQPEAGLWPERLGAILRPRGEEKMGLAALTFTGNAPEDSGDLPIRLVPLCLAVQTLRDLDPDFDQTIQQARLERGRTGSWNLVPLRRWLDFTENSLLDASGENALLEWLLVRLTSPWQQGLGELMRFHEQWGHGEVPADFPDNPSLAAWVDAQRKAYARGGLTAEQMTRLDQLGFVWDPKKAAWDHMFAALGVFHARHGHCRVEHPYPEDGSLSQWVLKQRRDHQQQRLEPGHVERLDSLGFVWDLEAWEWENNHDKLVKFKSSTGHAWITDPFPRDPELGVWAARQRSLLQKQRLDENRRLRLDAVGFVWDLEVAEWEQMFQQITVFKRLYGHAQVEEDDQRFGPLAAWCGQQRDLCQRRQLSPDRWQRLEKIGFVWDLQAAHWLEKWQQLRDFQARHGHLHPPEGDAAVAHLIPWIEEQRQLRAKNRLHPNRCNRLNALGFVWSAKQDQWETLFQRFLIFKRCHLHGNVPDRWPEDLELCGWVQDQRREHRRGTMDDDRRSRLTMAGFVWDPQALHWERMLTAFARFQRHHGDADPARVDPSLATLSDWMASQRRMRGSGRLAADLVDRLDALGFIWDTEVKFEKDMLCALQRFMDQHGHSHVPPDYTKPQALSSWVRKVRTRKATGALSEALEKKLETMGFVWDAREAEWEEMFAAIQKFAQERLHCIVPESLPENPRLPQWVNSLRKQYKNNALDQEKTDRLNQLGFVWDAKAIFWEEMFVALTGYHDRFGHCLVAENDPQYTQLAWWVVAQRKARAGGQLDEKRIQRLDRLHFVWDTHAAQWLEMYRELFFFHQRHGHCLVRNDSPQNVRLSDWCGIQRKARMMGHLAVEKQERLDKMGFIWDPKEVVVEEMLMNLLRYKERFGHCNVPVQWSENPPLGLWVQFQRQSHKKGTLDPGRKVRLQILGMNWEPDDQESV
ncbi:MAG TPA: hypothetical protein HPQ00_03925, partial [Magnetococcales bacterium]|nr:hypothetical protein [Magnetococcales bacterium]